MSSFDVQLLADAVHRTLCGPFTTVDPKQCIHGRDRDVRIAEALVTEYRRAGVHYHSSNTTETFGHQHVNDGAHEHTA